MEEDFNFGKLGKDLKQVIFCGERKRMKQEWQEEIKKKSYF